MGAEVLMPGEFVEALGNLRFPVKTDQRLQQLMSRNTQGILSNEERQELEALVELNETLSLIRARALRSLGKTP